MSRRVRAVRISGEFWQQFCTEGWSVGGERYATCLKGLPEGAEFKAAFYKEWQGHETIPELIFVFEHPDFEEVPEGDPIPALNIVHQEHRREETWRTPV